MRRRVHGSTFRSNSAATSSQLSPCCVATLASCSRRHSVSSVNILTAASASDNGSGAAERVPRAAKAAVAEQILDAVERLRSGA